MSGGGFNTLTPREQLASLIRTLDVPTEAKVRTACALLCEHQGNELDAFSITSEAASELFDALYRMKCAYSETLPALAYEARGIALRAGLQPDPVKRAQELANRLEMSA